MGDRELVAMDEAAIIPKPLLDSLVVESGQGDRGFPDSAGTNEGNWTKVPGEIDYLLDQFITPETGPWWWRWQFSRYTGFRCKITCSMVVQTADLV